MVRYLVRLDGELCGLEIWLGWDVMLLCLCWAELGCDYGWIRDSILLEIWGFGWVGFVLLGDLA